MASARTRSLSGFVTALTNNIDNVTTSFNVDSVAGLTSPAFFAIDPLSTTKREMIKVGSFGGGQFSSVSRGITGSVSGAQAHDAGTLVQVVFAHQMQDEIWDDIERLDANHAILKGGVLTEQILPNTPAYTQVVFDTVITDDDPLNNLTLNTGTGIITINTVGWYLLNIQIEFKTSTLQAGTDNRVLKIGSGTALAKTYGGPSVFEASLSLTQLFKWGATVEIEVYQDGGTGETIDNQGTNFTMMRVPYLAL